jgi:hypothetical protein
MMVAQEKNYICRFTRFCEVLKPRMNGSTGGNKTKEAVGIL